MERVDKVNDYRFKPIYRPEFVRGHIDPEVLMCGDAMKKLWVVEPNSELYIRDSLYTVTPASILTPLIGDFIFNIAALEEGLSSLIIERKKDLVSSSFVINSRKNERGFIHPLKNIEYLFFPVSERFEWGATYGVWAAPSITSNFINSFELLNDTKKTKIFSIYLFFALVDKIRISKSENIPERWRSGINKIYEDGYPIGSIFSFEWLEKVKKLEVEKLPNIAYRVFTDIFKGVASREDIDTPDIMTDFMSKPIVLKLRNWNAPQFHFFDPDTGEDDSLSLRNPLSITGLSTIQTDEIEEIKVCGDENQLEKVRQILRFSGQYYLSNNVSILSEEERREGISCDSRYSGGYNVGMFKNDAKSGKLVAYHRNKLSKKSYFPEYSKSHETPSLGNTGPLAGSHIKDKSIDEILVELILDFPEDLGLRKMDIDGWGVFDSIRDWSSMPTIEEIMELDDPYAPLLSRDYCYPCI